MKHQDPLDESRSFYVDSLIDDAIDNSHRRHMEEKGRLLKERCAVELDRCEDKIIQRDLRVDS